MAQKSTANTRTSRTARRTSAGTRSANTARNGKDEPPQKGRVREWVDALLFALIAAMIIRTFFFEAFRIPTPSMEKNLLVGDFLLVSKLHYGPRTPITLGIPFTSIYLHSLELPFTRLPGFDSIDRGDAVVFNYPPEDAPIDRKTHYIKRAMGLPGDTLEVVDKVVSINGTQMPLSEGMQQLWVVHKAGPRVELPGARLRELGITQARTLNDPTQIEINTTAEAAAAIAEWPYVERVEPSTLPTTVHYPSQVFPRGTDYNRDQYGPLYIPQQGATVTLTDENWTTYERLISEYEGHTVRAIGNNEFMIDGQRTDSYTFEQNYYFMMGDNRDDSQDSRSWGFVPEDHLVGKAFMIYFSWDQETNLPRFGRLLNLIH